MSQPAETVVGAQVVTSPGSTEPERNASLLPPTPLAPCVTASSSTSTPSVQQGQTVEFDPSIGAKPYSPFYRHPTTTTSLEQIKSEVKISTRGYNSQDLESGMRTPYKQSMDIQNYRASKLWEKKRRCNCLGSLSKEQKIAVKLLIAVLIVGTMIGIALGITAAVGGAVWRSNGRQYGIGQRR